MKKSILISAIILCSLIGCASITMFFKPDSSSEVKNINESVTPVVQGQSELQKDSSETDIDKNSNKINNDTTNNENADSDVTVLQKETDSTVDFNSLVYGDEAKVGTKDGTNKNLSNDNETKKHLSNTKSNLGIKPINPETDIANKLSNSKAVKPLKTDPAKKVEEENTQENNE